jgi:acyl carrier protein
VKKKDPEYWKKVGLLNQAFETEEKKMNQDTLSMVVHEIAAMMGVPEDSLGPDTSLTEIGVDSLEALQLLIELERVAEIQIDEADMKHFTTIQSIVDLLNERFQKAAAA